MDNKDRITYHRNQIKYLERGTPSRTIKPRTLKTLSSLLRALISPFIEYRLRIIKYPNSVELLDIRKFKKTEEYTGFTEEGVSLNQDQVMALYLALPDIIKEMDILAANRNAFTQTYPSAMTKEEYENKTEATEAIDDSTSTT